MSREILLRVGGVPPKKDGANSMWRKRSELDRLRVLRLEAAMRLSEAPVDRTPDEVRLVVFAPRSAGDLDNFLTGIFDGLQAAHPNTPIDAADWDGLPEAALPGHALFVRDDGEIQRATVERRTPRGPERYELTLVWQ